MGCTSDNTNKYFIVNKWYTPPHYNIFLNLIYYIKLWKEISNKRIYLIFVEIFNFLISYLISFTFHNEKGSFQKSISKLTQFQRFKKIQTMRLIYNMIFVNIFCLFDCLLSYRYRDFVFDLHLQIFLLFKFFRTVRILN